jgi:prevent-host-death family protein
MKTYSLAEARSDIEAVLNSAQKERVVVTRAGKPSAVIVGVEGYDAEDIALASSADFWRLIEERRQGRTIPLAEIKKRLEAREKKEKRRPSTNAQKRKRSEKP